MNNTLSLVSNDDTRPSKVIDTPSGNTAEPPLIAQPRRGPWARRLQELRADEHGAVTAEYAIVILASVS